MQGTVVIGFMVALLVSSLVTCEARMRVKDDFAKERFRARGIVANRAKRLTNEAFDSFYPAESLIRTYRRAYNY
uniref:RxLR effector protein n=1 Tax=Ascaris lumbricoides TaxID=6252 RepID=A0A0M3I8D6_ASCLU